MADEKEVIVTSGDGGGGAMVAVVLLVVVILVGAFLYFGTNLLRGGDTNLKADVKIDAPATGRN